jgi:prepilin peptidase CpaA
MVDPYGAVLFILINLAALHDVRHRRIPNPVTCIIVALWAAYALWNSPADPAASLGVAAAVLAAGFLCWHLGWLGGGDAKLLAALSLWAGPEHALPMLSVVALAGGVLASLMAFARQPAVSLLLACISLHGVGARSAGSSPGERSAGDPVHGWPDRAGRLSVPYGVAIAAGGYWLIHRLFLG